MTAIKKKSINKKRNSNQVNNSHKMNPINLNFNNSSISSITSPSVTKKSLESGRVFSPFNINYRNNKKQNINNFKYKEQAITPKNLNKNKINYEQKKQIKKSFLGKYKNDDDSEKTEKNSNKYNINLDNSIRSDITPVGKLALNEKIKNSEEKEKEKVKNEEKETEIEIPGLKELDKDIMKTYNINNRDEIINKDINIDDIMRDKSNEFNFFKVDNEKDLTPFQKKEKLIKKLLRTKNYDHFVKNMLNNEPILINQDGKYIKFNTFNKDIYNYEFLDVYYCHNIPFIIMRPRLDVIKRKREAKLKKILEEQEKEENEEIKNDIKLISNNSNDTESQMTYRFENKSNSELSESVTIRKSNTITIPGTFVLTKMPQRTEENTHNKRLNIAFNKAKDAARVVRRLEYSYGMRINILLSKPIFQKNAKVIQNWWKDVTFAKRNKNTILKLQAYIRGTMIRKAFKEAKHTYLYIIPFLKEIDRIISRRILKIYFDKMVAKHGILKLLNKTKSYSDKITSALQSFKNKKDFQRQYNLLFCPKKNKCCYTKEIFDWEAKCKLYKVQAAVKSYLMHHNEKIIKELYTNKYNPKLFYLLKYANDKDKLKKKLKGFRQTFLKFKELKCKATLPGNINNKFLFFKYVLRRIIFNNLLNCYLDSLNNKDSNYQQRMKMKILCNHFENKRNNNLLRKYFTKWNVKSEYLKEFNKVMCYDKLYVLEAIFRYQRKYKEKIFMLMLQKIQKEKNEKLSEGAQKAYDLYNRRNGFDYENNLLRRILHLWKKKAYEKAMNNAATSINLAAKKFLCRKNLKKLNFLKKCLDIRNKKFREKLQLWKFNSRKINHHFNFFKKKTLSIIRMREKLNCLRNNFESLLARQKEVLRKYFNRFKTNTGVRKLVLINVQLCFFNENKEIISRDKYSMLKYIRNPNYIDFDKIKKDIVLKKNFDFWKIEKKAAGLKRLCGKRISDLCTRAFYLEKLKFLHWHKIIEQQRYDKASRLIQKNYHIYLENKGKKNYKNNNVDNKTETDMPKKKKRWKRYDRTIKNENYK